MSVHWSNPPGMGGLTPGGQQGTCARTCAGLIRVRIALSESPLCDSYFTDYRSTKYMPAYHVYLQDSQEVALYFLRPLVHLTHDVKNDNSSPGFSDRNFSLQYLEVKMTEPGIFCIQRRQSNSNTKIWPLYHKREMFVFFNTYAHCAREYMPEYPD